MPGPGTGAGKANIDADVDRRAEHDLFEHASVHHNACFLLADLADHPSSFIDYEQSKT
jgi:hypothetical protein